MTVLERLLNKTKLSETGCLEWTGYCQKTGYGRIKVSGEALTTHRVSWETYKGKIPMGMHVLHKCDNRKCVNPEHLYLGTQLENNQDTWKRKRRLPMAGENSPRVKLTDEQVLEIIKCKLTPKQISDQYNISSSYVWSLRNLKTRRSIELGLGESK